MHELPRNLPLLVLDESARRQLGYLVPPIASHFFRHPRLEADQPPGSLIESETPALALPRIQMGALSRELPDEGDLLMALCSPRDGKKRLQEGLQCFSGKGRRIHAVVSNDLLLRLTQEEITRFLEQTACIVSVANRHVMAEQLSGCLDGIATVLATSSRSRLDGLLEWQGTRHYSKPFICIEELQSGSYKFFQRNDLLVASIEPSLEPDLRLELEKHGLGCLPVAVGHRECGVRIGMFRAVSRKVGAHE